MKNKILLQTHITKDLDDFLREQAKKHGMTRAGMNRMYLTLIKSGKIKVEGIG
jgi:hypothetical protein